MRGLLTSERGFTLLEVMVAIVLLSFGLLAVADVFSRGLVLGLYGEDQTRGAGLAQQQVEFLKTQPTQQSGACPATPIAQTASAGLNCLVGDYGTNVVSTAYFDRNGAPTAQATAYYSRDVQIQYWVWNGGSPGQFVANSPTPYTVAASQFVYRISVATHWLVKNQTTYKSGQVSPNVNGCVLPGSPTTATPTGLGCVQVSTFVSP